MINTTTVTLGNFRFTIPHKDHYTTNIIRGKSTSGIEVIVKIFPNDSSGEVPNNFLKERAVLKKLAKKKYVCKPYVISTIPDYNISVIIMEKYDSDLFHYAFERNSDLSNYAILSIFTKICKGVAKLHDAGIAHLDLKPENILINHRNKDVVLCDFDHSYIKPSRRRKSSLVALGKRGTAQYNAPEQKLGCRVDPFAVDIYSLGCILYVLSTGYFPKMNACNELVFCPEHNLSLECERFINFLMEYNPMDRPSIHKVLKHPFLSQNELPHTK